jgi:hypothetical protein
MQTPKPNPKILKGPAAIKQYKKETSPQGVAKRDAEAKAALEKKYPGMYVPKTRTTTMIPNR